MLKRYIPVLLLYSLCSGAVQAQDSAFEILGVTEKIKLQEHIDEASGTMSGSLRPTIRTNELFSAFQLITKDEYPVIRMAHLRNAPITAPTGLSGEGLRLCTEIRTINGFYNAVGTSSVLTKLGEDGQSAVDSLVQADESDLIDSIYTEDLMLMRSFVALDCVQARSQYYVPLYFSEAPDVVPADTFLAVFEIGNATIEADLHGVNSDGQPSTEKLFSLECAETTRVDVGFDCTFDLTKLEGEEYPLFELRLLIMQPHRTKPLRPVLRVSIPDAD